MTFKIARLDELFYLVQGQQLSLSFEVPSDAVHSFASGVGRVAVLSDEQSLCPVTLIQ
jgi:hypothetical protein